QGAQARDQAPDLGATVARDPRAHLKVLDGIGDGGAIDRAKLGELLGGESRPWRETGHACFPFSRWATIVLTGAGRATRGKRDQAATVAGGSGCGRGNGAASCSPAG